MHNGTKIGNNMENQSQTEYQLPFLGIRNPRDVAPHEAALGVFRSHNGQWYGQLWRDNLGPFNTRTEAETDLIRFCRTHGEDVSSQHSGFAAGLVWICTGLVLLAIVGTAGWLLVERIIK
jgi:hypothetical protein